MALSALRFAGDPILEACAAGNHRMFSGEEGIAVARVQAALAELGYSIGVAGVDGSFGIDTGAAVSQFKVDHGLSPSDPVVGVGTMTKLDELFFVGPPALDPVFAEFSPFVLARRLEPFVARELARYLAAPIDSWRHMAAWQALAALSDERLAGIVAGSRFGDLQAHFLFTANSVQGALAATDWFEAQRAEFVDAQGNPVPSAASGITFDYRDGFNNRIGIIVVSDKLIRGKSVTIVAATGQTLPDDLAETVIHELVHFRNLKEQDAVLATSDFDTTSYIDVNVAAFLTLTTPRPTSSVLLAFIDEIGARHVEWHIRQERNGTAAQIAMLTHQQFAAAVISYMVEFPGLFDNGNGYVHQINARPDGVAARLRQAALWLRRLHAYHFSDLPIDDATTRQRLLDAADFCEAQADGGAIIDPLDPKGIYPLLIDFP